MNKSTFLEIANEYIKNIECNEKFKLNSILGKDCPAYPGSWLYEAIRNKEFNTSSYVVELIERDYSDTYVKESI